LLLYVVFLDCQRYSGWFSCLEFVGFLFL